MTNILLEGYEINAPWLFDSLKDYIRPFQKVVIIALAFRDTRVKNLDDWNALYEKDHGCYYSGIVGSLADYGIPESQIEFINYFADTPETANQKIRNADILDFTADSEVEQTVPNSKKRPFLLLVMYAIVKKRPKDIC